MAGALVDHRQACEGFSAAVRSSSGTWDAPTPCAGWDARDIVEHVIGFHDVLLLRPLDAEPRRPRDDPVARWDLTVDALFDALSRPGVLDGRRASLLAVLTTDVLVHTWDLGRATGLATSLDPRLCRIGLERALANRETLGTSGMFGPRVEMPDDATVQDRLLGELGRDPAWSRRG